jgi:hypothetical protein
MAGSAGRPNSGDSGEGIGRERVWGGGGAHPRPICHLTQGRGAAGGVLRRRRRLPTAVSPCSSKVAAGARNGRLGKLLQMRGGVEEGSVGLTAGRNPELAAAASNGASGGSGRGRQERGELALWRLLYSASVPPCCAEWRRGGPAMGRTRAARGQHGRTERPRVRARHAAARTPAALGVRARLGKVRCLGERATSGSATCLGTRAGSTTRRGCARHLAGMTSRRGWSSAENIPTRQL